MDFTQLNDEQLLREFESKVKLHKTLGGTLYPNILMEEIEAIGQECIRRHTHHPNHWREKGIVPASWTDEHGVTHAWKHWVVARKPDDPVRMVTCLQCVAK